MWTDPPPTHTTIWSSSTAKQRSSSVHPSISGQKVTDVSFVKCTVQGGNAYVGMVLEGG